MFHIISSASTSRPSKSERHPFSSSDRIAAMEPGQVQVTRDQNVTPIFDTLAGLNWNTFQQVSVDEAMRSTDWDKLCQLASDLNNNMPCTLLDKQNAGLNSLIKVLEFADTTRWVARIPLHLGKREQDSTLLRSEVHTMQLIRECCGSHLPVPRVFAYEADARNRVGVPFILMELLLANTAMDSAGGYSVHRGVIPKDHRPNFYRSVAHCQVHLTHLRFPKIGTIIGRVDTGAFDIGPLPHIGGPFETASAFFTAWADHVKFDKERSEVIRMMPAEPPGLAEQVADAIENFPAQIRALVTRRPPLHNNGPFPLIHTDFLHSNMLVDSQFNLVGVIDWEGAQTVPWECVSFPGFLEAMPPSFDLPTNYDASGQPLDQATRELWEERRQYVELVKAAEYTAAVERGGTDDMLSASLDDHNTQALAYIIRAYEDIGKLGFYDKVVDQL